MVSGLNAQLFNSVFQYCVVPEKFRTHPMEGHWKFLGEGGGGLKG